MKDTELIQSIAGRMDALLEEAHYQLPVLQLNQPLEQGVTDRGAVYFQKLYDYDYGFPQILYTKDSDGQSIEIEKQFTESTFRISVLFQQTPGTVDLSSASDILLLLKMGLQSRSFLRILQESGANILRTTQIQNGYFKDDQERFTALPFFNFTVAHHRIFTNPIIDTIKTAEIEPILL